MREKEHEEYNALTKRLLEEGYSAEHHPDYVRVDVPMWQEKTLDNYMVHLLCTQKLTWLII